MKCQLRKGPYPGGLTKHCPRKGGKHSVGRKGIGDWVRDGEM